MNDDIWLPAFLLGMQTGIVICMAAIVVSMLSKRATEDEP